MSFANAATCSGVISARLEFCSAIQCLLHFAELLTNG